MTNFKSLVKLDIQYFAAAPAPQSGGFDSKTFNPQAFGQYVERVPNLKRNELLKSRALAPNAEIRTLFSSQTGSYYATIPLFGLLDGEALNYDGVTDIDATSTDTYEQGVIVYGRAKAWVEKDFSQDITSGVAFMDNVAQQVAQYWEEIDQDVLLAILEGIFNMTGKENLEFVNKHTYDVSEKTGLGQNLVGPTTLNTAIQQAAGQNKTAFTLVIMHSVVATNLENMKLLKYMTYTDAQGIERELTLATWNGRTVIIDDSMPTETATKSIEVETGKTPEGTPIIESQEQEVTVYTSFVLGEGAFSYENLGAKVPFEMSRDPKTNGGQDTLYSRQRKVLAPKGISFTSANVKTLSPTNAEFKDGKNWELVKAKGDSSKKFDHKAIPIARIKSLG